jgi:hypothetical protein
MSFITALRVKYYWNEINYLNELSESELELELLE